MLSWAPPHSLCICFETNSASNPGRDVLIEEPGEPSRPATSWSDLFLLENAEKVRNVSNYVYYCLLVRLLDKGFRLRMDEDGFREGRLERIPRIWDTQSTLRGDTVVSWFA